MKNARLADRFKRAVFKRNVPKKSVQNRFQNVAIVVDQQT